MNKNTPTPIPASPRIPKIIYKAMFALFSIAKVYSVLPHSATSDFNSHAYSRKYSRFVRLRLLGFKASCFRNVNSKKDTQSFFESPLPTSLSSFVVSEWLLIMLLIGDQQRSQRKRQVLRPAFSLYLELKMTTHTYFII